MSVIVFYPESALEFVASNLLAKYRYEPLEDCLASDMVEAYYDRMVAIRKHISNPVFSMPQIYFDNEKIAHEIGKDFFGPFFNGIITGCEGFMALQCLDVDGSKQNASVILFGVDASGQPLPNAKGYKFFEKWPGILLSDASDVLTTYFPACPREHPPHSFIPMRGPLFNIRESSSLAVTPVTYLVAQVLMQAGAKKWKAVSAHLTSPTTPPPQLPAANVQNLVLRVDKNEVDTYIFGSLIDPVKVACILCMNDHDTSSDTDDTFSVILVGVDGSDRPVSARALEKWPGRYLVNELTDVLTTVLTPVASPLPWDFAQAQAAATKFTAKWNDLLDDTDGTIKIPRPEIRKNNHPLVFMIDATALRTLNNTPGCAALACVFGYAEGAGQEFIAPMFVALDKDDKTGRPVSDMLFTDAGNIAYSVSQVNTVTNVVLTP